MNFYRFTNFAERLLYSIFDKHYYKHKYYYEMHYYKQCHWLGET